MEVLHTTGRKRETYDVQFTFSPLWECALGIAAVTNSRLMNTLEKPETYWEELKESLSKNLLNHLEFVEKNNTWKALLQLLHHSDTDNLDDFCSNIEMLQGSTFKFICLPFIGDRFQHLRERAAVGEESAILELKRITSENPFFPQYIEFISLTDVDELKAHLLEVMTLWYETVIRPDLELTNQILRTDYESKNQMKEKMSSEELVQWATGGVNYLPEPSVHKVLLIPQYVYRPWNIEADIEDTKVFYYPVANESLSPNDKYMPSNFLVQKHKALGDEIRLRIVKLLSEKDRSLQELTEQLNMGKTTIHHHLKLLRAAKIVEMNEAKYSLKTNVIDLLFKELDQYIKQ
ncbi:metalloregulator ArsR/SmtB family transcription factor [Alkalihalophilus lindianensis]|uniref:Metalloregulator ArsR/SmtB family transcription factor n=1 Tax=Alkalihalophilus lindianensis TaxID=1630542 RepID=A0ABU3X815_9BACI|nr:metalloregulator ArsR/SmtB family transcription factor [Alkalihalophilus lindianensis]MDV2684040.1 metalloregulator ArsR/SmtB family transcription factor [Alkalihalophilus lindianensis]